MEVLLVFSNLYNPLVPTKPFVQDIDWYPILYGEGKDLVAPFLLEEIEKGSLWEL